MNILVTGANGQLGREMRIISDVTEDRYIFTDVQELDITDAAAVDRAVTDNKADIIVNCAAYTNVDKAEQEIDLCRRLNADAPAILARAAKGTGALLIHISTDYVFGDDPYNTPCREDQTGTPTGVYGLTKLEGERSIIESGCKYVIIRTSWMYSEYGKNFVKTMLSLTSQKPSLKVVFDQVGTPTYAYDLAEAILRIIENYGQSSHGIPYAKSGIYHYSNEGVCSWYDFAKAIAFISGNTACDIQPCHSSEFPSPVRRPAYSVLDKSKIKKAFGISVPYWRDSLEICIDNITTDGQ